MLVVQFFRLSITFVLTALILVSAQYANAQTPGVNIVLPNNVSGPYSTYFPAGQTGYVPITGATAGVGGGASVAGGVNISNGGVATIVRGGIETKIPTAIGSTVSKAAVSGVAAAGFRVALRLAGPIGLGISAYQIYQEIKASGVKTCPPPDFFCMPTESSNYYYIAPGFSIQYGSPGDAAGARSGQIYQQNGCTSAGSYCPTSITGCATNGDPDTYVCNTNASNYPTISISRHLLSTGSGPDRPATDSDISAAMTAAQNADTSGGKSKRLFDAADAVSQKDIAAGGPGIPASQMVPNNSPTVVTASPATTAPVVRSTENFTDANGVPQTRTVTDTATITPTLSGNGAESHITYQTTNVTTTSVTNNTPTTTNNPPTTTVKTDSTAPLPPEDKGPKECGSPGKPKCLIDETGTPDGTALTGQTDIDTIKAKNAEAVTQGAAITTASVGITAWFPSVPTAACVNPQVPTPITGTMLDVHICEPINVLRVFISGVICFFLLVASVREVQSAIKA